MRHTPYLNSIGVVFKEDVPDYAVNIIDNALAIINARIEWGEYEGKKRKPCPEQPLLLSGQPIGQYHCPMCGMMVMAGMPHLSPAAPKNQDIRYPLDDFEIEYGYPWPPGYEGEDAA